ncbi:hypothetical protein [Caballeronia concitans]|uniref:hypothetical protein n=1 Tax=Caballeronia concitans TaxID=1777133 RepID=UPI000A708698|nr:hypothetical protein [Caballeronia concitans]
MRGRPVSNGSSPNDSPAHSLARAIETAEAHVAVDDELKLAIPVALPIAHILSGANSSARVASSSTVKSSRGATLSSAINVNPES